MAGMLPKKAVENYQRQLDDIESQIKGLRMPLQQKGKELLRSPLRRF